jgi:hypothetical protein
MKLLLKLAIIETLSYVDGMVPKKLAPAISVSTHQTSKNGPSVITDGTSLPASLNPRASKTEPVRENPLPADPCVGTRVKAPLSAAQSAEGGVWAKAADEPQNMRSTIRHVADKETVRFINLRDILKS